MNFRRRDIFLKIEPLPSYSPLAPVACARHFGRDCMFNTGHESGRIPAQEILASTADSLVYREYLDAHYTVPTKAKLIEADVNEPPWDRRIPGCLLYAKPASGCIFTPGTRIQAVVIVFISMGCATESNRGTGVSPRCRLLVAGGTKEYDNDGHPFVGLETSYLFDALSEIMGSPRMDG